MGVRTPIAQSVRSHRRWIAVAGLVVLATTGCGNRLPHDEIVAARAANTASATAASGTQDGAGPAEANDMQAATGVAGATTPVENGTAGAGEPTTPSGASTGSTPAAASASASAARPTGGSGQATTGARPAAAAPGTKAAAPVAGAPSSGSATPAAPAGPGSGTPITLGHIGTYTGIVGAAMSGGLGAVQVWAKSVNARGGLNGHPVKLVTADDGGDPARSLAIAKNMVENSGVIAFVANLTPISVTGSEAYLREKQVPVLGGDLVEPFWHNSPILFPQGTYINNILVASVKFAVEEGKKKLALFYCAEANPCANANKVFDNEKGAEKAGAQLTYKAQISLAQPDFTSECLRARNSGADVVFLASDGATMTRVARSCAQQGYKPQYVTASIAVTNDAAKEPNLDGIMAPGAWFPWVANDTPATQDYQRAMATYGANIVPSGATAAVWTGGKMLEKVAAGFPATPTSADVLRGLWSFKSETLDGLAPPLTFKQGDSGDKASTCVFKLRVVKGQWTAPLGSNLTNC